MSKAAMRHAGIVTCVVVLNILLGGCASQPPGAGLDIAVREVMK